MSPTKILFCIESRDHFDVSKTEAGWIARHLDCALVLFHSSPESWLDAGPTLQDHKVDSQWLDSLVEDPALANIEIETHCRADFASLTDSIFDAAKETGCDLILVPTHARSGLDHLMVGSVAERVLRSCRMPTMTLDLGKMPQRKSDAAFDQIVCPVDFSAQATEALNEGAALAKKLNVGLTLVHSIDDYFSAAYPIDGIPSLDVYLPELVENVTKKLDNMAAVTAETRNVETKSVTDVGQLISVMNGALEQFKNPLIVMSTAGRDSLGDHILGSRTERLVRHAHVPVLALPGKKD